MDPVAIYQAHLDRVSQAIWDGDFRCAADAMLYPHVMKTRDAAREVHTPEELMAIAENFCAHLRGFGATAYHRVADRAAFVGDGQDRIDGVHHVYVLNGGSYVVDPYMGEMTLIRRGDVWLGGGIRADIRNSHMKMLSSGDHPLHVRAT
ncbi:MAG: hypothetical protein AAF366_16865 [Pseudomonadota bacterium]